MSVQSLEKYLPENTLPFLKKWFGEEYIHIKITKERHSKLGDYRKLPDGSHEITVNSTLEPQLFFFVLTHELAHLIAFEKFGRRIFAHGQEWKYTFGSMLVESILIYKEDLRAILLRFAKSPKANFMSSTELVRYYRIKNDNENDIFVEDLLPGETFLYRKEKFLLQERLKKNYLCKSLKTGKIYSFKPIVKVDKCS